MKKRLEIELRLTDSISDHIGMTLAAPMQTNVMQLLEEGLIPDGAKKVIVTVSMDSPNRVYAAVETKPQSQVTGFYLQRRPAYLSNEGGVHPMKPLSDKGLLEKPQDTLRDDAWDKVHQALEKAKFKLIGIAHEWYPINKGSDDGYWTAMHVWENRDYRLVLENDGCCIHMYAFISSTPFATFPKDEIGDDLLAEIARMKQTRRRSK